MPKSRLPRDIIAHWPEVFKDIKVKSVPLDYLHSLRVEFKDGKVWEIDCNVTRAQNQDGLERALKELFEHYDSAIKHVDFRLNTSKVKRDIQKKTRAFIKKPKAK